MERVVPQYVSRSVPVPLNSRVPWYKSTFPTYAGIFLWVGFYLKLAEPTIGYANISVCLWGLLVAGLLCFGLYYYVPAMLGMQTGHPLYVVGTSTFGTTGGYGGGLYQLWKTMVRATARNQLGRLYRMDRRFSCRNPRAPSGNTSNMG